MAKLDEPQRVDGIAAHFSRYAGLFAFVLIGIVLFDILPGILSIRSLRTKGRRQTSWPWFSSSLPFYLLHSFISLFVCFVLLRYMDDGMGR